MLLITGTSLRATSLSKQLTAQRFPHLVCPSIAIEPLPPVPLDLTEWSVHDLAIFVSQQAVHHCPAMLYQQLIEKNIPIIAIGPATAAALTQVGLTVAALPLENYHSEALLDLAIFQSLSDRKILLCRGAEGKTLLAETLSERGAQVTHQVVYRRCLPTIDKTPVIAALQQHQITAVVTTSLDGLKNFLILFGEYLNLLYTIPLLVVSESMRVVAMAAGFTKIHLAQNATNDALLVCLQGLRRND